MPPRRKRPKATKSQPEVWVSPDLMSTLKGAGGHRGVPLPQSPYLLLADRFLGLGPDGTVVSKPAHRAASGNSGHKPRESAAAPEPAPRAMAAAAAGAGSDGVVSSIPPRIVYPKPPARPAPPKPPRLTVARPNLPRLQPPKPPKMSFAYRRRKVDPAK
jgi:hypothetical protein